MAELVVNDDELVVTTPRLELPNSREALAAVALGRALGTAGRRLLERRKAAAILITVPSAEWVDPIEGAVRAIHPQVKFVETHEKPSQKKEAGKVAAFAIAAGQTVVGVSNDPEALLPGIMVSAATHRFTVPELDTGMLAAAMKLCLTGRAPAALRDLELSGADFDLICACMPKGVNKKDAVGRLARVLSKEPAKLKTGELILPRLEDAIEYGEARSWGLELCADIADLKLGKITWSDIDRGCILEGPPGSGKTTFARILGQACGLEVIVGSVSELFASSAGYLDSVIKAQRELFERAAAAAPCILFLDEINAMPDLATISPRGKDWWAPVVLDFYLLLDSMITARDGVIVVGATNRIEDISPVMMRPGRLERSIHVGTPDAAGLASILRTHVGGELPDVDLLSLAKDGEGATAALAMDWVRSARRRSRRAGRPLSREDLALQITPPDTRSETDRYRAAVHEAGHAVIGLAVGEPLLTVGITSRGPSGGRAVFKFVDEFQLDRQSLERRVTMILAGSAAEIEVNGTASTGAGGPRGSDLGRATILLTRMRASYGMAETLLWRSPPEAVDELLKYDPTLRAEVEADLQRLHSAARDLAQQRRREILAVADTLMKAGTMSKAQVLEAIAAAQVKDF